MDGRYYMMPMLSGWTDVFAAPGSRTTGDEGGDFAIVRPGWNGELPAGVTRVDSPTSMAWLIGRTGTAGTKDYLAVHRLQDQYLLTPLSRFEPDARPPPVPSVHWRRRVGAGGPGGPDGRADVLRPAGRAAGRQPAPAGHDAMCDSLADSGCGRATG